MPREQKASHCTGSSSRVLEIARSARSTRVHDDARIAEVLPQTMQPAARPRSRMRAARASCIDGGRLANHGSCAPAKPIDAAKSICARGSLDPALAGNSGASGDRKPRWAAYRRFQVKARLPSAAQPAAASFQEGMASVSRAARQRLVTRCPGTSPRQSDPCGRVALRPCMRRGSASTPIGDPPAATDFAI